MHDTILPETGFVRLPTILKIFPVSKSTWWAGVKANSFPQPVKLGPKVTAWRVEDIKSLIASKGAHSDGAAKTQTLRNLRK